MIIPGATPKVTISAKLSNCFPIFELTFNSLADSPSKKSRNDPVKIKTPANKISDSKIITMESNPQTKFPKVIRLGIFLLITLIKLQ